MYVYVYAYVHVYVYVYVYVYACVYACACACACVYLRCGIVAKPSKMQFATDGSREAAAPVKAGSSHSGCSRSQAQCGTGGSRLGVDDDDDMFADVATSAQVYQYACVLDDDDDVDVDVARRAHVHHYICVLDDDDDGDDVDVERSARV